MSNALETVHDYLRERFTNMFVDPTDGEVAVPIGFRGATVWLRVRVFADGDLLAVASQFPVCTPPDLYPAMSEYLQRCSEGLGIGGFRLDFDDGCVIFQTSLFFGGASLEPKHVSHLVEKNLSAAQAAYAGMLAVAYGGMAPKEAVGLPMWPERLLVDDLDRTITEILGSAAEPASAAEQGSAPEPTASDPERADALARLQNLLRRVVLEASGDDAESQPLDEREAA